MARPKTKTKSQSVNEYMSKAYDSLRIVVPKGDKDTIKATAESLGESLNGYVRAAIQQRMESGK